MVNHVSVWCIVKQNPADKEPADFTPTHTHTQIRVDDIILCNNIIV